MGNAGVESIFSTMSIDRTQIRGSASSKKCTIGLDELMLTMSTLTPRKCSISNVRGYMIITWLIR